jgi:sugar lactone lactonase YvrE
VGTPTVWHDVESILGEGPVWDAQRGRLVWVDILAGVVRVGEAAQDGIWVEREYQVPMHVGAAVPIADDDSWLLAAGLGFAYLDSSGEVRTIAEPEEDNPIAVRMNDGSCDPAGRFWAGSMGYGDEPGVGSLYRLDLDGSVHRVLEGLTISNGLGWSPDAATMYVTDSGTDTITRYSYDIGTGEIYDPRPFLRADRGRHGTPDGLAVDAEGGVWVAFWGGSALRRYSPSGELLQTVPVPVSHPTSCCFGGPALDILFITSAGPKAVNTNGEGPHGRLLAYRPSVAGLASTPFRGSRWI